MGLVAAVPEAEGLPRLALREERLEVAGVINRGDPSHRRLDAAVVVLGAGRIPLEAAGFEVARTPALPRKPDLVARILEQVGVDLELGREDPVVAHRLLELPGVASGQHRRAARAAL